MRKLPLLFLMLMGSSCLAADYQPRCKDIISYGYDMYQQAIKSAKEGDCQKSFAQFKESEKQWIYISKLPICSQEEKEYAESSKFRITYDMGILRQRYCPSV